MIRVSLEIEDGYLGRFAFAEECRAQLLDLGVDCARDLAGADLRIVHDAVLRRHPVPVRALDRPTIVYERIDAAALNVRAGPRRLLAHPQVKAWFKETGYRDKALYNGEHAAGRRHLLDLARSAPGGAEPPAPVGEPDLRVPEADLAKIVIWPPVHLQAKIRPARAIRPKRLDQRRKDVAFAGTVDYGTDLIARHRLRACQEVMGLPAGNRLIGLGRVFAAPDYLEMLADTKVFVSPYGYGEYSFKDFEAAYAGAILVRPPCAHIETAMFDIYRQGYCVVETDPWMSDLGTVYQRILDEQAHLFERAQAVREELIATHDPGAIAGRFAAVLRAALER